MKELSVTYDMANTLFDYCKDTGVITRKISTNNRNKAGDEAGRINSQGYRCVSVNYIKIRIHRLVWMMHYGSWPDGEVDHIDHQKTNNRISNLRLVTHHENTKNTSKSKANTSGKTGVSFDKLNKKWESYISSGGKKIKLGRFDTVELAVEARKSAEVTFNYHANHGK